MSGVIAAAERQRADVLRQLQLAADQADDWDNQRNDLVCKAFALGVSQRKIAPYAQVDQATVSRIIARARASEGGAGDVG
jgi:hypothetical protein